MGGFRQNNGYLPMEATLTPREHRSKKPPAETILRPLFLYFSDITEANLKQAAEAETKADLRKLLKEFMKIDQPEGLRAEILVDMHYHNYSFCMSKGFPPEKTSTFLSIMKILLEDAIRERLTPEDAFSRFQDLLLKHSVERPPRSVGIFSFDDVTSLVEYVTNTFFRHYRLYMYAFSTKCDLRLQIHEPHEGIVPTVKSLPMHINEEVDPQVQPELAHLFRPSEEEEAENELRRIREEMQDPRAALIKKRVEEGVARLLENFEEQLAEQDKRFESMLGSS